jgi:hypothetical protein
MNTSKPGADLLPLITSIIQSAIDSGEHGNPSEFAHEILAAVEDHYSEKRDSLFNRKGLTRLARQT